MEPIWIILICFSAAVAIVLLVSMVCYFKIFHSPTRKDRAENDYDLPPGKEYEPFYPQMIEWTKRCRATPHRNVEITTFDGLTLRGRYYEFSPDAPIEIMMHGYHGNSERDLSGGVFRALNIGHSVLVYDHRGSGISDGIIITFGINESRDCRQWIDFVLKEINPNAKIILSGVSMGAATAMITSGFDNLPKNVVGIIADCGYTSAEEIIKKVIKDMGLPPKLLYPFVQIGARVFGGFNIDEFSPIEQVKKSNLPTIFVHGDRDFFVPLEMSKTNCDACNASKKELYIVEGAAHGLAFIVAGDKYLDKLHEFFDPITNNNGL
ncbi:MAG: alpha/beta hydrolase [Clostridia bacterium]|nr:alpha/beta hydrolase [Clostridia bacterium]